MNIVFDEVKHEYLVDGFKYPSVTQILQSAGYIDLSRIPKHILEYKRDIGSNVHLATAYYDQGILDEATVGEAERPYFEGYKKFIKEVQPEIIAIEMPVASIKYRFCGTLDRKMRIDSYLSIVEEKNTAKVEPASKVQTMAYLIAHNEINPKDKAKKRYILHLTKEADYDLIPCTKDAEDRTAFLNALGVHNWKEKNL